MKKDPPKEFVLVLRWKPEGNDHRRYEVSVGEHVWIVTKQSGDDLASSRALGSAAAHVLREAGATAGDIVRCPQLIGMPLTIVSLSGENRRSAVPLCAWNSGRDAILRCDADGPAPAPPPPLLAPPPSPR